MVRRPDLGYRDEGITLSDPKTFDSVCLPFGEAAALPRLAFRSLQFLYLEDEAIWTREWVPISTVHEIPEDGDILPFTLGYHGIHVQRIGYNFTGRFNLAQHGGCRIVPTQCQQGERTSCSFTSCGYSRDRGPISKIEGQDDTRTMYQYLGLRPERLHPVHVEQIGPLLFVNIDPSGDKTELAGELDLPDRLNGPGVERLHRAWLEFDANWKFSGQALARTEALLTSSDRFMEGHRTALDGTDMSVRWVFPNMILLCQGGETCVITLQHTAITKTLFRVEILSDGPVGADRLAFWQAELTDAGATAETLQAAVPSSAALDVTSDIAASRQQRDLAAWWAQNALVSRIANMPNVDSDIPIFRNVEHYLI
ncbi:hypothetical protein [Roseobacter litoralis]|uniref:Rieske domain-containing protein n=1 Tax=Roseobacter litoralis (strain ATCC 49566 / DSM 6996 / JCM 21268 / NBRC 15278 / OCh 149) TaxID=391595 RepID=F7ZG76_ROSLO|nr:hypothetical protein [Roseobacter litoralis]AEI94807.1 hypothetical protein RLO149_c028470 [Roseobacter litoralis Och 149]